MAKTTISAGIPAKKLPAWAATIGDVKAFDQRSYSPSAFGVRSLPTKTPSLNIGKVDFNAGSVKPDILGNAVGGLKKIAPYASNIVNQFDKPPMPIQRTTLDPVSLNKVNYDNDRAETNRITRGADISADRTLDGNTAAAVKVANLTQNMRAMSSINQHESNYNAQIGNQEIQMNSRIAERNAGALDEFNQDKLERTLATKGNRSANLANAADKFTATQNEEANRELDKQKMAINARMYQDINPRFQEYLKGLGVKTNRFGGKLRRAF